jgi:hypothetical protein
MSGSEPYPLIGLQITTEFISTDDLPCYDQNKRAAPNRRKTAVMQPKKSELFSAISKFWKPKVIPSVWPINSVSASIRVTYEESVKYL